MPLLRPDDLFDSQLADIDHVLFLGNDPAALLHDLLGTGIAAAHVLSTFYVAFIVFLPLSLGLALVFAERLKVSLFYATALSINWIHRRRHLLPAPGPRADLLRPRRRSPTSRTRRSRASRTC